VVDVKGTGGGNINVNVRNLNLTAEEVNDTIIGSSLRAGIAADSTSAEAQAGDVNINATGSVTFDRSFIFNNNVELEGVGKGNSGNINLTTVNLALTNSSSITTDTFGQGDASLIDINATESITINYFSSISSGVTSGAEGNGGELNIITPNLSLTNISSIDVATFGQGDGGKLSINTANLSLTNFSSIDGDTFEQGSGGSIDINATESITLDDLSSISSSVSFEAEGNGGDLNITSPNLSLTKDSSINADTSGQGDAGSININTTESITLDDSSISSTVPFLDIEGNGGNIQIATGDFSLSNNARVDASTSGMGNGGEINITADNFSLTNGGNIFASTVGSDAENIAQGDGGNITIDVADTLSVNGTNSTEIGIFASNQGNSSGNAGDIDITASKLSLINGGQINSFTRGNGNAGNTTINAQDSIFLSGENSEGIPSAIFNRHLRNKNFLVKLSSLMNFANLK
jgi:large exoprotein involved in heme utilization and adhesion